MASTAEKPIQLDQFLKLANVVATGGQAKRLIQSGEVKLNGKVETGRKKILSPGDIVEVFGMELEVVLEE